MVTSKKSTSAKRTLAKIQVRVGDVYCFGPYDDLVVEGLDTGRRFATVRRPDSGRASRIKVSRLQEEYDRAGLKRQARMLRRLAVVRAANREQS